MRRREVDQLLQPPVELVDLPGEPFFPYSQPGDPEVVAAVAAWRAAVDSWCVRRAEWAAVHGWPEGEDERLELERIVLASARDCTGCL